MNTVTHFEEMLGLLLGHKINVNAAGAAALLRGTMLEDGMNGPVRDAVETALENALSPSAESNSYGVAILVQEALIETAA